MLPQTSIPHSKLVTRSTRTSKREHMTKGSGRWNTKKRAYDQRIREVEHGTFTPLIFSCTPLIFSCTGGMGRAAVVTYKRLATLIAMKRDTPYSVTMGWIRCRLSFSLLQAAIMCLRGTSSSVGHALRQPEAPIDLVTSVGQVPQL